jgi:hypothetical protein
MYDQASAQLAGLVKKQPGFMMPVAYPSPGGFSVGEVWESRGQFETWFNESVKPNVPRCPARGDRAARGRAAIGRSAVEFPFRRTQSPVALRRAADWTSGPAWSAANECSARPCIFV